MADEIKRSNEQIDKLNEFRKGFGQEPLPYETDAAKAPENTDNIKQPEGGQKPEGDQKPEGEIKKTELTKEQKEEIAKELFGVADLSEMVNKNQLKKEPTPEEIEAKKEQRENEKIAYALKNGKVSKKQYEGYITDIKNPAAIVLAEYIQDQKENDPDLTEEEITDEFKEKFGLNEEPDSRRFKRGAKEIGLLAENILKNKYDNIYKLDNEYSLFENEQLTQKQRNDRILEEAPKYKQVVDEIYTDLKSMKISLGDGDDYEVEIPDDVINSFKDREFNTDFAAEQISNGYTKEDKLTAAKQAIIIENFATIIKSVAQKYLHKRQAGVKGIPPLDGQKTAEPRKLTPEQQASVDRIYGKEAALAN